MDLGPRLSAWLKAKGKSQRQLALSLRLTPGAISLWVTGANPPSQKNLARAVEFLGLTMEQFYGPLPKVRAPKKTAKAAKRAVA